MIDRAKLVRRVLWFFGQHRIRPSTSVEAVRRRLEFLGALALRPPRAARFTPADAGGVPAECAAAPQSRADRWVIYLHGGGYVVGSAALYRDFAWRLAAASGASVLSLDYRLAPEDPFPAALDDVVKAYRWLLAKGAEPRHVAIAGDSAGGSLALAALLRLRDEGDPLPAAAAAISPWTDLAMTGASLQGDASLDPLVAIGTSKRAIEYYLAGADPRLPYASPLYGDPAGLPPTLIMVGSDEQLRDDSVRMADKMRAAGCEIEIDVLPRIFHAWQVFTRVLPEARRTIVRIGAFLQSRMG